MIAVRSKCAGMHSYLGVILYILHRNGAKIILNKSFIFKFTPLRSFIVSKCIIFGIWNPYFSALNILYYLFVQLKRCLLGVFITIKLFYGETCNLNGLECKGMEYLIPEMYNFKSR